MNQTAYEKGLEIGIEIGIERGKLLIQQEAAISIYCAKFGTVPGQIRDHVLRIPRPDLLALILRMCRANSPEQIGLAEVTT